MTESKWTDRRIAVIGAGPGGIIALNSFLNHGFTHVTVFERRPVAGGTWTLDEQIGKTPEYDIPDVSKPPQELDAPHKVPKEALDGTRENPVVVEALPVQAFDESSLYPQVETNVLAELMSFSDKPFPPIHPPRTYERFGQADAFRDHSVIRDYLLDYLKDKSSHLVLNTSVERVYQANGPGAGPGPTSPWTIIFKQAGTNGAPDKWWSDEFDFIYTASGFFNVPKIPRIPGLAEAVRKVPKRTIIHTKVFRGPEEFQGLKRVLLLGASWSNSDVAHIIHDVIDDPVHVALHSIESYVLPSFAQPWIETHPGITRIDASSSHGRLDVVFEDGSKLLDVDKLVIGTGYAHTYPFLAEYLTEAGAPITEDARKVKNLYWNTWWTLDASLAVSSVFTESIFWRAIETQARATAYLWSGGTGAWPTSDAGSKWQVAHPPRFARDPYRWFPDYDVFFRGIIQAATGGYDQFPDGTPIEYLKFKYLVEKSLGLKGQWFINQAVNTLKLHPELQDRYDRTLSFLRSRELTTN